MCSDAERAKRIKALKAEVGCVRLIVGVMDCLFVCRYVSDIICYRIVITSTPALGLLGSIVSLSVSLSLPVSSSASVSAVFFALSRRPIKIQCDLFHVNSRGYS